MGLWAWLTRAFGATPAPAALTSGEPVTRVKPLWEQYGRIGGGLTPIDVSWIIREADQGNRTRLVDLMSETRQRDGHIQGILYTRETAATLVQLDFIAPPNATKRELKLLDLQKRVVSGFRNWSTMVEHLNGALHGDGTVELKPWEQTEDGYLVPRECKPLHARDFFFAQDTGQIRYSRFMGDQVGVDLLAENPGRVVQVLRRINGGVQAQEGLARGLVWDGLLRNWDLRDWVGCGEVGWKPRMWAKYGAGMNEEDQQQLLRRLEMIQERGIGVFPEGTDVEVKWPTGSGQTGTHKELHDTLGREASKRVLGQTTSIEVGPNGARADTEQRDVIRTDIQQCDLMAIAGALLWQVFVHVGAINFGPKVRVSIPYFVTDEGEEKLDFASAIEKLKAAGLRIPAGWTRDEFGMPDPEEGEEIVGGGEGDKGTVGAQTDAITKVLTLVATGQIPRESGIQIFITVMGMTPEQAELQMGDVGKSFVPAPEPGTVPPAPTEPTPSPEPTPESEPEPDDMGEDMNEPDDMPGMDDAA